MTQVSELSLLFHHENSAQIPYMIINGSRRYDYGDRISSQYGLIDTVLDERFWKYFCFLALRRYFDVKEGWVSVQELHKLFDNELKKGAGGTRKYFERRIKYYNSLDVLNEPHLIQYAPLSEKYSVRGISVGPYRISVGRPHLHLSPANCTSYILGPERIITVSGDMDINEVIDDIDKLFAAGAFFEARLLQIQAIGYLFIHKEDKNLNAIADLWKQLAATEMFLGLSRHSIQSADNAIWFYKKIGRSYYRIAQCLHIKANAQGQLGDYPESLSTLKHGEFILRKRVSSSIDIAKQLSYFIIDTGKNLSHVGNKYSGAKTLEKAKHKIMTGESEEPVSAIELRLAQHHMRNKEWTKAEKSLGNMHQTPDTLRINEYALYLRAVSEFYLRTKKWEEARACCEEAIEYGIRNELRNHMKHMNNITSKLRELGQWEEG